MCSKAALPLQHGPFKPPLVLGNAERDRMLDPLPGNLSVRIHMALRAQGPPEFGCPRLQCPW